MYPNDKIIIFFSKYDYPLTYLYKKSSTRFLAIYDFSYLSDHWYTTFKIDFKGFKFKFSGLEDECGSVDIKFFIQTFFSSISFNAYTENHLIVIDCYILNQVKNVSAYHL